MTGGTGGRALIACDLDSTLIYSRRTAGADVTGLHCVEWRDGAPAAYMTERAAELLGALSGATELVPVTTRTRAQLARVRLPGHTTFAIVANGGHLLVDGRVDDSWSRAVARRLRHGAALDEAARRCAKVSELLGGRAHQVESLFCFTVAPDAIPGDVVAAESTWADLTGWRFSAQGRKAYWVPAGLTKSAAVAEVARRCDAAVVLAAGDSILDADLFDVAAAGIRPAHGELAESGWNAPHVAVTHARGAAAGEEIVAWLAAAVDSGGLAAGAAPAAAPPQQ